MTTPTNRTGGTDQPDQPAPVVPGNYANVHDAALLIATAFEPLPVCRWLVPDSAERVRVLYGNFRIWVEHAIAHGELWLTDDRTGVAVWFPRDPGLIFPEVDRYRERLRIACGTNTDRFLVLDEALDQHHPHEAHHHLALLAVHPQHHNRGIGSALLAHHHARLDQAGLPAYLEASSVDSYRLYKRHGYRDWGPPIEIAGSGALFWPLWRDPQPPATGDPAGTADATAEPEHQTEHQTGHQTDRRGDGVRQTNAGYAAHPTNVVLSGRPGTSFAAILANRRLVDTVLRRMLDQQVADAEAGR